MKSLTFLTWWLGCALIGAPRLRAADELEEGFRHPPASSRPWVYWFWLDGNVTKEGLTADLEACQRAGIGGAVLFDVSQYIPQGPVRFFSPEWRALFKHTLTEARRLGLEIDLHNAPGWSGSGGPWITPDLGMQMLVCSRTNLAGPSHFQARLPPLTTTAFPAHELATLAFPALVGEGAPVPGFTPTLTASSTKDFRGANLLDRNPATRVRLPPPAGRQPQFLQLAFAEPFTASVLTLDGPGSAQSFRGELQVSDNGRKFRTVREFINTRPTLSLEFETTSARYFRIVFTDADPHLAGLEFSELELAPLYRIELARAKSGLGPLPARESPVRPALNVPPSSIIALSNLVELTAHTSADGLLDWEVPAGQWTVLRFGYVPTGESNHPAMPGGHGLECDKLSKAALEAHFDAFLGQLLRENGENAGRSWTGTHIDSWEIGYQNWTSLFREEFQQRRGYDPLPYLPAVSGRFVGSAEQSERFFWDMRRTVADLLADNYAGHLAELAHRHRLQLSLEAFGSQGSGPFDELLYAARADVPMGEFWLTAGGAPQLNLKGMPSAAHTGGKSIAAAEAFTSYPTFAKWQNHPFTLKPFADAAFCQGINRLVIHCYAHQPWLGRRPGMTAGPWGLNYGRTDTWWEQSTAWHQYLARCQYLLQRGRFVADLCYLTDEGAYTKAPAPAQLSPPPPPGFDYDLATAETVLTRMSVKGGAIVLPDGMSYRVLVLPPGDRMTPKLLRKIKELVEAGATILGPPPAQSPSLTGYPGCDAEVQQLARGLWGDCDGKSVREHAVGHGKIFWGEPLEQVLGGSPDFHSVPPGSGSGLRYIHRRLEGADIYFVANLVSSSKESETIQCQFRVSGKQPEFWHPETGMLEKPATWREEHGVTIVPLKFEPAGSLFVLFRRPAAGLNPVVAVTRDGRAENSASATFATDGNLRLLAAKSGRYELQPASGKTLRAEARDLPDPLEIAGLWAVDFPPDTGAPAHIRLERLSSWTEHPDPGVKYFSGTATYRTRVTVPKQFSEPHRRLFLDLGRVQVIAELKVNGQSLGILWKPPFEADVMAALKPGENELEIRVTNLWPNRLIGDEQLPDDCQWRPVTDEGQALVKWPQWFLDGKPGPTGRLTFATWKHWKKDAPLLESGLLGPVTLRVAAELSPE